MNKQKQNYENKVYIITAAGGNATAIKVLMDKKNRSYYALNGSDLIKKNEAKEVEQAGFLILNQNYFEMSGGEFCGNAARAAALLLSKIKQKEKVEFTMSGFNGLVSAKVKTLTETDYEVSCFFPDMKPIIKELALDQPATLVDLGGIVHVVIESDFPESDFKERHLAISKSLNLLNREAVGVIWVKRDKTKIRINPVVWVKEINSFFYESSCGSGSIAVACVMKNKKIIQPSGGIIEVRINDQEINLKSRMEVKNETN
jgi:diaminopimelate epimerase